MSGVSNVAPPMPVSTAVTATAAATDLRLSVRGPLPSPVVSRQVSPTDTTTSTASMSSGHRPPLPGGIAPSSQGAGRYPGLLPSPKTILPPHALQGYQQPQHRAQTAHMHPQQSQISQPHGHPSTKHAPHKTYSSPEMGREQISQSPQYHDLVGLIKRTDPVVVRQVVRDLHETCLLGSDYHYAFLLNTVFHKASPATLERCVADFGEPLAKAARQSIVRFFNAEDIDAVADVLLSKASSDVLDRALAKRLETIRAKALVTALAKAERLGYDFKDVVEERRDGTEHVEHVIPYLRQDLAQEPPQLPEHRRSSQGPQGAAAIKASTLMTPSPVSGTGDIDGREQFLRCGRCQRPCAGASALSWHKKHACGGSALVRDVNRTVCAACGTSFSGTPGLNYHVKMSVCGSWTEEQVEALLPALGEFYQRDVSAREPPSLENQGQGRQERSAAPASLGGPNPYTQFKAVNKALPGNHAIATPPTSSRGADPYAHLTPDDRAKFESDMRLAAEKYGEAMQKVAHLPQEQRDIELGKLKNSYNTKQSVTRKKYGIRLRERRTKEEIDRERDYIMSLSTSSPQQTPASRSRSWSTYEGRGAMSGPPTKKRRPDDDEKFANASQNGASPGKMTVPPRVPVGQMGGLGSSAATAEHTDPTKSPTSGQSGGAVGVRSEAVDDAPGVSVSRIQGEPMQLDDVLGQSTDTDSDSEDEDDDFPATHLPAAADK